MREWCEHAIEIMRDAILTGVNALVDLPNDPFAPEAVLRAGRYLHGHHIPDILETLLANQLPAYWEAVGSSQVHDTPDGHRNAGTAADVGAGWQGRD